jgi:hypothetical protein
MNGNESGSVRRRIPTVRLTKILPLKVECDRRARVDGVMYGNTTDAEPAASRSVSGVGVDQRYLAG